MTKIISKKNLPTIKHEFWIKESNLILEMYDFPITLRHLFYMLVSNGFIEKSQKRYKSLSSHLVKGRLEGKIEWERIVDYTREVTDLRSNYQKILKKIKDIKEILNDPYELPQEFGQKHLNLFYLEKDSLKPFIEPFLYPNSILVIGKGQNSWSNAYELNKIIGNIDINIHLYTLIDFDLSGIYIHNSFVNQLEEFNIDIVEIKNIAVTEEQIKKYDLPVSPIKNEVQLQALDPLILRNLVIDTCKVNWDKELYEKKTSLQKEMNSLYRKKLDRNLKKFLKVFRKD